MGCKECGKPKCNGKCGCNSPKVLQINNPAEYITFHKVSIPAAMGDSTTNPPKIGAYRNALVYYEADHTSWMYSTDGIPTLVTGEQGETGPQGPAGTVAVGTTTTGEPGTQARVYNSGTDSNAVLNFEIPRGDVGPSVPLVQETGNSTTKAMSQNATTEALNGKQNTLTAGSNITISGNTISATDTTYTAGDNVQINGTVISATDTTYTAGANIQIENGVISATDTKYTNGNGLNLNGTEFSADTDVLATKEDLEGYYTKPETDNLLAPKLEAEVVTELPTTGTEGKLYLTPKNYTRGTGTGNPITATVTEEAGQLESFQLDGDTFQQTYTGKNLFDGQNPDVRMNYIINDSGNEVTDSTGGYTRNYSKVLPETQYILSGLINAGTRRIYYYDNSKNFISRSDGSTGDSTITFTTPANCYYVNVQFYTRTDTDTEMAKWQIEAGSQATSFEPYVGGVPSPNPDYPQPIQTVTGEQTAEIQGKNLFRAKDGQYRDSTLTVDVVNGVIHVYGRQHASYDQNVWIPVEDIHADGTYTLTMNYSGLGGGSFRLAKDKSYQAANNFGGTYYSPNRGTPVTASATNITYNWVLIYLGHSSTLGEVNYYINPQFESGSSSTDFAPYSHQTLPINLGSIELCKIGTYQDYIYKDGNDWKVHKATEKTTLDGSEAWYNAGGNAPFGLVIDGALITTFDDNPPLVYCDKFYPVSQNASWSSYESLISTNNINDSTKTIRIKYTDMASLGDFKTWLGDNNTILYYVLAAATDTVITDSNLIAQLEAIRTASLANGTNTITNTATGTNLAGDMELGYYEYDPTNRYDKWLWLRANNAYEEF